MKIMEKAFSRLCDNCNDDDDSLRQSYHHHSHHDHHHQNHHHQHYITRRSLFSIPFYFNLLFYSLLICLLVSCFAIFSFWFSHTSIISSSSSPSLLKTIDDAMDDVLMELSNAPHYVIEDNHLLSSPTNDTCNHFNCFDIYRCGINNNDNPIDGDEKISVYIYPAINYIDKSHTSISSPLTHEYYQLIEAIVKSPFYTNHAESACILMPNIDLLNQNYVRLEETSQILASLPYWNDGTNHLVFNMVSGSFPDYNTQLDVNMGKAIIAGAGFDARTFRQTFDVPIPVFSPFSEIHYNAIDDHYLLTKKRKWLIVAAQFDSISPKFKDILKEIEEEYSSHVLVLGHHCTEVPSNNSKQLCNDYRKLLFDYPEVLSDATFCLVMRTAFLGNPILSDALMSGCIPVVIADHYVMPFEEKIDWIRLSLRVNEFDFVKLYDILRSQTEDQINQFKRHTLYIWRNYFSSMKVIALTTLSIINERIFPHTAKPIEEMNMSINPMINPLALVNPKFSSRQIYGFTAVILTYDRLESLFEVIRSVIRAPSCVKVLIVWNNQIKKPPQHNKWPNVHIPLQIIQTKSNKLSNRFYPYDDIHTDAILAIDDDIVMLTPDELEFGYQSWREFPDRIVGFPPRVHRWDNITHKWRYESEWTNDISMVLTGAAFYHKYYNHLYYNIMPNEIKTYVDEKMNCEDIAMNFLVSNVTGKAPIKVTPRKKFKCPECTNNEMISNDVIQHLNERSECINRFVSVYGLMPLKIAEFRADPILYKDNLPEKLKKFNHIGTL